MTSIKHSIEFMLLRLVRRMVSVLSWKKALALGGALGALAYRLDARHRKLTLANLRDSDLDLGEGKATEVARACFRHFGSALTATLRVDAMSPAEFEALVILEGLEHFDAVQAAGRGFIQLTGHYGCWELVALAQSLAGRPLAVIGRPMDNPLIDQELERFRCRFGNTVISKRGAVRETLKALREGKGVGFLLDQDALTSGVFVRFLGRWASTFPTAATLALRQDLPILPVFSWPEPDGRIHVRFHPPFHLPKSGDPERDVWTGTQLLCLCIEEQIRRDPRWWFWMHRRFKTRPGEGDPLPAPLPRPEWLQALGLTPPETDSVSLSDSYHETHSRQAGTGPEASQAGAAG